MKKIVLAIAVVATALVGFGVGSSASAAPIDTKQLEAQNGQVRCSWCNGSGFRGNINCPLCRGTGRTCSY